MTTPIVDFIDKYVSDKPLRLHMPGHKGKTVTGAEAFDITEIDGADELYKASGIIKESEENAGKLFGAKTFYSAEGSTLSIKAMLYLAVKYAAEKGESPFILAGRNAHTSFITASAALGFDFEWIYPENGSYESCVFSAERLFGILSEKEKTPTAVYITSPDYLGNVADVKGIAEVCEKFGTLLLVDNAHGAYLGFLPENIHPIALGATACADSAHKTLPVLTGGAYLHVSENAPAVFKEEAKDALAFFGSTSPSYLVLRSLDKANEILSSTFPRDLKEAARRVSRLKAEVKKLGFEEVGNEPMKMTLAPKSYGYTGREIAKILRIRNVYTEFSDEDYVVFMFGVDFSENEFNRLIEAFYNIERREKKLGSFPPVKVCERVYTPREILQKPIKTVGIEEAEGKVFAGFSFSCPPAVPIVVCGERIDEKAVETLKYYGVYECKVVKEDQ